LGWILISTILVFATGAMSDDARKMYTDLFGEMEKEVLATASKKDDVEMAKVLLDSIKSLEDKQELKILVLTRACDLATAAGDMETASQAIELLIKTAPDNRLQWEQKRLDICRTRYNASRGEARKTAGAAYVAQMLKVGDAALQAGKSKEAIAGYQKAYMMARANRLPEAESIRERMKEITAEAARFLRLEQLKAQLEAKPDDPEIQKNLAMEYVLVLDDPPGAMKILKNVEDLELTTYLEYAAKPANQLGADECFELAEWYRGLCNNASSAKKKTAAGRSALYYSGFLALYEKKDVKRLKARHELKTMEKLAGPDSVRAAAAKFSSNLLPNGSFDTGGLSSWQLSAKAKSRVALKAGAGTGSSNGVEINFPYGALLSAPLAVKVGGEDTLRLKVLKAAASRPIVARARVLAGGKAFGAAYLTLGPKNPLAKDASIVIPFRAIADSIQVEVSSLGAGKGSIIVDDVILAPLSGPAGPPVFLDDLKPLKVRVGYPKTGNPGYHGDLGYSGKRVSLNGHGTKHSLSLHPATRSDSYTRYDIGGKARVFRATAMINDGSRSATSLTCRVVGDGKQLWRSRPNKIAADPESCEVDVSGVKSLEFFVDCPGSYVNAHAVWWEARLLK